MLLLAVRLAFAAVFALAAAGKIADRPGSRKALEDFRLPSSLAAPGAFLLPLFELATAVLLVVMPTARVGAAVGLVLLAGFVTGIGLAMRRGESPDCHCFGQLHSEPAGRSTLIRNGVLAAVAIVLLADPGRSVASLAGKDLALMLVSLLALVSTPVAALQMRENRKLRAQMTRRQALQGAQGLPPGTPVPALELTALDNTSVSLDSLLDVGHPVALVMVSPSCGPCQALMPELARWESALADTLTVRAVSMGDADRSREFAERHGVESMLVGDAQALRSRLRISPTPSAMLIGTDGRVSAAPAVGAPAIEALIRVSVSPDPVLRVIQV